jgi:hypothetical protein
VLVGRQAESRGIAAARSVNRPTSNSVDTGGEMGHFFQGSAQLNHETGRVSPSIKAGHPCAAAAGQQMVQDIF